MKNSLKEISFRMFQLAYFLHPKRELALGLMQQSWTVLDAQLKPQRKRRYYSLHGRILAGVSVKARTKVSAEDIQTLQSLVYFESEKLERAQEERLLASSDLSVCEWPWRLTEEDWLIRFIEYLISLTVTRSSFYVALGIGRIVFNYSTEETTKIYDAILQDPDRLKDATYFRKRKNELLMKSLKQRFGDALRSHVVTRGEQRFQCSTDSEHFRPIVKDSLEVFTPWNTGCVLPERLDPVNQIIEELTFKDDDPDTEHPIEFRRMHTLIHPECFSRLTAALKLDSPQERLQIPMFFISHFANRTPGAGPGRGGLHAGDLPPGNDRRHPPPLTEEEFEQLQSLIRTGSRRRKRAAPSLVSVIVDREERARVRLDEPGPTKLPLDEQARLIEVRQLDKEGALLLGSLILDERELLRARPSTTYALRLAGRRELLLTLWPLQDENQQFLGANIEVTLHTLPYFGGLRGLQDAVKVRFQHLFHKPTLTFALLLSLVTAAIGFIVWRRQATPADFVAQVQSESSPRPLPANRDPLGADVSPSPRAQTSPPNQASQQTRQSREAIPGTGADEGTRALPSEILRELASTRKIYVEVQGDARNTILRETLIKTIAASGRVRATDEASADAILVWTTERIGGLRQIEMRLLSRAGRVLWSATRRIEKGEDEIAAQQMVREMLTRLAQ